MTTLADRNIRQAFLVTGGGAMHLNDAIGLESRLHHVCCHHEQACAMAAEGYARVTGRPALVCVTTGPGGINALNGVFGAWTDSIPMVVISGQVKRETCMASYPDLRLRQLGDQEADIIRMVRGITKYAVLVAEPESIQYHLERALYLAEHGRPGPVWLDIPIDVQAATIQPAALRVYDPAEDEISRPADLEATASEVLRRLQQAQRPIILPGSGIRLAGALEDFQQLIRTLNIPVALTWTAIDLLANTDPLYAGRAGTIGDRAGNFSVQNADLVLIFGSRLNIRQVGYNWNCFARHACKIQVDIDPAELAKPTVRPDLPICADLKAFLAGLNRQASQMPWDASRHGSWLAWCQERVRRYPAVLPKQRAWRGRINPYAFMDELSRQLAPDDTVVCGNGSACVITFQAAQVTAGQRYFTNSGCASMGYDLPAAIGAACATKGRRVICLAGDGSIQMNLQELQTLVHHRLPVKLVVLDNGGYASIRQTQNAFFERRIGEGPTSGVTFPDMLRLATAYALPACRLDTADFSSALRQFLAAPGPAVAVAALDPNQPFEPKVSSKKLADGRMVSAPLEDMFPFLDRIEFTDNMIGPATGNA